MTSNQKRRRKVKGTDSKHYFVFVCLVSFFLAAFLGNGCLSHNLHDDAHHEQKLSILNDFRQPPEQSQSSSKPFKGFRPVISKRSSPYIPDVPYFMVFSTSCVDQQHWESYVFFYHARKVNQPGTVTRIVSGCSETEEAQQRAFFEMFIQPMALLNQVFQIHFTPHFGQAEDHTGKTVHYKYMNKPFGLQHWMEHVLHMNDESKKDQNIDDGIIFLLDPDMVLLRPLIHDFTEEDVVFVEEHPATRVVRHGYPMSQQGMYLHMYIYIYVGMPSYSTLQYLHLIYL